MTRSRKKESDVYPWHAPYELIEAVRLRAKQKGMRVSAFITWVMTCYFEGDIPSLQELRKLRKKPWYLQ